MIKKARITSILIVCFLIVVSSAFFVVQISNFNPKTSLVWANADSQNTDYQTFADKLREMNKQNPVDENALVFFDKDDDLIIDDDGNYYVTEPVFETLTNTDVELTNDVSYNLDDLATVTGYQIEDGEFNVVLSRQFATKRLIIKSDLAFQDCCGAVAVANFKNLYIVQYATESDTSNAYQYYQTQPNIDVWVDEMCWVEDETEPSNNFTTFGLGDSYSYKTWGAEKMGAIDYNRYLNDTINAGNTNYTKLPEVVVAVLDTGIDTDHPWFNGRMLLDESGKIIGEDYTNVHETGYSFEDEQGHGTHCAGIVCDMTLSNVKILPIKFMKKNIISTGGSSSDAIAGMLYAIQMKQKYNIVAVNMSFGSSSTATNPYTDAIKALYNAGIFSITAAGNDNVDAVNHRPSNSDYAIAVSSIDSSLTKSSFSNYGESIDVCAPGGSINSASITGGTAYKSGTSMAAPHVAAFVALLKSDPKKKYSMTDIENILSNKYQGIKTIIDIGDTGKDIYFGYGLPTLENLAPGYATVNLSCTEHGSISRSGKIIYSIESNDIVVSLRPDNFYCVAGIYVNGKLAPNTKNITSYTLPKTKGTYTILVKFDVSEVVYTVNHYREPIYDVNDPTSIPEFSKYLLFKTENLIGKYFETTQVIAKNYTGFTPLDIVQKEIKDNTVIDVYYKRNCYNVRIQDPQNGLKSVTGNGKQLFGDTVFLSAIMKNPYSGITWKLKENLNINLYGFNPKALKQSFTMPASDLTFVANLDYKTFLINVNIVGNGKVTPTTKMVKYGESVDFDFIPDDGYMVKSVLRNGSKIKHTGTSYVANAVKDNLELTVIFDEIQNCTVEENPENDNNESNVEDNNNYTLFWNNTAIFSGVVVIISVLGGCVIVILISIKKSK